MSTLENCLILTYLSCFSTQVHIKKIVEIRLVYLMQLSFYFLFLTAIFKPLEAFIREIEDAVACQDG